MILSIILCWILEYCSPIWSPSLQYIATSIEKVQRRATKLVYGFDEIPYEALLWELDLPSLQFRRHREDIITDLKICKIYPDLKYIFNFQPSQVLRVHDFCFQKEQFRSRLFKNSLTLTLTKLSSPVGRHPCRAPSSPELSQSDIQSRTQSRTRQAASVAGEAVTIVEKPF